MKTIIRLCVAIVIVTASSEETYNPLFDDFDIKPLLEHPRTLRHYGKCFLDKGPCTPEGLEIKKSIPEALETVCGKCTPKQRELVRIVIRAFMAKQPDIWNEMVEKMDPTGKYLLSFNKFLNETD